MALTDYVTIDLAAGSGGNGVVRWRREKYIPRGGPAGGDGGNGGDVFIVGVKDNTKLDYFTGKKLLKAGDGVHGGSNKLYGENGSDLVLEVPIGTLVTNLETGQEYDVVDNNSIKVLSGGRGGLGNVHFKSSTNQTPQEQTDGKAGQTGSFSMELRLIADAGLIGLPSAGKSTLLNFLTNSKSKVAEYHFTTLEPHLGALQEFVLADVPGLIRGASKGKGLGHKFLQHIQRTQLLLHCVSLESEDVLADYKIIREELEQYDKELAARPEQVILTKSDVVDDKELKKAIKQFDKPLVVSVLDNESVKELSDNIVKLLRAE